LTKKRTKKSYSDTAKKAARTRARKGKTKAKRTAKRTTKLTQAQLKNIRHDAANKAWVTRKKKFGKDGHVGPPATKPKPKKGGKLSPAQKAARTRAKASKRKGKGKGKRKGKGKGKKGKWPPKWGIGNPLYDYQQAQKKLKK